MLALRIPTHPVFFPLVFIVITLGALFAAGTIIFFAVVSTPRAIYHTLKEVYVKDAE
jgi:hypothetical protein